MRYTARKVGCLMAFLFLGSAALAAPSYASAPATDSKFFSPPQPDGVSLFSHTGMVPKPLGIGWPETRAVGDCTCPWLWDTNSWSIP
jgi:hypothetical protein